MKPEFFRKILNNGMTVILEKRDLPIVSVSFGLRAGGIHENIEEKGISHFIEHMLFKGTEKRDARQIAFELEKKGGDLNAHTADEMTAFHCKLPSEHLNVALDVLSDMIKNPKFDEQELEKERLVIFEELKMYKDNPIKHVFDELQNSLYGGTLGMYLIGTEETLKNMTREDLIQRFRKSSTPNNLVLCVVGDADFDELVQFAEENFSGEEEILENKEFSLQNKENIEERAGIDQANLVFGYHVPTANEAGAYAGKVLSVLMAEGMSSRLFTEIREKRNLAYGVKGGSHVNKFFAYNFVYVGTVKEKVEEVKSLILKEFEDVANNLSEKELGETKEQLLGAYQIAMEDSSEQMSNLMFFELLGNAENFYKFEDKIRAVNLEDVKNLAKKAIEEYSFYALVPQ